jgi:hypothetical protein
LSKQQFENKIYTLAHIIIIAASGYYQHKVDYNEYKAIIDFLLSNTSTVKTRVKDDIIIEVGLSLQLVDESFSEIETIQSSIHNKVDHQKNMILSVKGKSKFGQGEHRNIIAVFLLDWRGCSTFPSSKVIRSLSSFLAESLTLK